MRLPSIKTLSQIFGDEAKQARFILEVDNTRLITGKAVDDLRWNSYGRQRKRTIRLTALNELGDFHGIESAESTNGEYAEYLNAGDSYALTLIYWRGNYRVQSIGDFVETMERQRVYFK